MKLLSPNFGCNKNKNNSYNKSQEPYPKCAIINFF